MDKLVTSSKQTTYGPPAPSAAKTDNPPMLTVVRTSDLGKPLSLTSLPPDSFCQSDYIKYFPGKGLSANEKDRRKSKPAGGADIPSIDATIKCFSNPENYNPTSPRNQAMMADAKGFWGQLSPAKISHIFRTDNGRAFQIIRTLPGSPDEEIFTIFLSRMDNSSLGGLAQYLERNGQNFPAAVISSGTMANWTPDREARWNTIVDWSGLAPEKKLQLKFSSKGAEGAEFTKILLGFARA
jgi:hypothetical protein